MRTPLSNPAAPRTATPARDASPDSPASPVSHRGARLARALAVALAAGLAACSSLESIRLDRDEIPVYLANAEEDIRSGDLESSIEPLVIVWNQDGLTAQERSRTETLLQTAVVDLLEIYRGEGYDSGDLVRIYDLPMPTRLRALAGVLAAEKRLAEGRRVAAYKTILSVDTKLPQHSMRFLAGDVLARAGLSLIEDSGRYNVFFTYRARGIGALEYLVLNYPSDSACPAAYAALAARYEADHELDLAIERREDLLVYHPGSPYAVESEARLPYLRMLRLERDSYDRSEMIEAKREIDRWLARHAGHELEDEVLGYQRQCLASLANSDLIVARHYRRKRSTFGTRIHAERALVEARNAGDETLMREAQALLDELPGEILTYEEPVGPIQPAAGGEGSPEATP